MLDDRGVGPINEPIRLAATPIGRHCKADIQDTGDRSGSGQSDELDSAELEVRDDALADACPACDVRLPKVQPDPDGSQDPADLTVIHDGMIATRPYVSVNRQ